MKNLIKLENAANAARDAYHAASTLSIDAFCSGNVANAALASKNSVDAANAYVIAFKKYAVAFAASLIP